MSRNNIIKGTLVLSATGVLIKFLGFLFRIVLSRKIGSVNVGTYQLTLPVVTLCHAISVSGIEITLSKRTAFLKNDADKIKNAIHCTFFSVGLGTFCEIILFIFSKLISKYYLHNMDCLNLLRAMAFSIPFTCIHSMFYSYNIGKEKTAFPALSQLTEQAVRIISLLIITINLDSAMAAVIASITGELSAVLLCFINAGGKKIKKEFFRYSPSLLKTIFKLSYPVTLNRIILTAIQSIEISFIPMMLELYGYTKESALSYLGIITGMALPMILFPTTLVNSFSLMMIPVVSKNRDSVKKIRGYSLMTIGLSVAFGIFCVAFFIIIGARITAMMFNNSELVSITKKLSPICPFIFINVTLKTILNSLDKSFNVLFNNVFSETVCLVFIVFLIPKYGIGAYITGLITSQAVSSLLNICSIKKIIRQT